MRELGYVEGGTVETAYVYADGQFDRLAGLAAMLPSCWTGGDARGQ
jgi:hypothetical protein